MPCRHKFEAYLDLDNIDFRPTTLIIGTFNPVWPQNNHAPWFYGRTHDDYGNQNNNFWDVLPKLYGNASLINSTHLQWKQFCRDKQIAITDIIKAINDADDNNPAHLNLIGSYSDENIANNFYDFELVNLVAILRKHPTIQNVYVTRTITASFWKHKMYPVKRYCEITHKTLKSILTPSGYAYLQQGKYNRQNPNAQLHLADYTYMRWHEMWHPLNRLE